MGDKGGCKNDNVTTKHKSKHGSEGCARGVRECVCAWRVTDEEGERRDGRCSKDGSVHISFNCEIDKKVKHVSISEA